MKKTFTALVAVATMAGSLVSVAPSARADNGRIAAGVAGGLIGGALIGGAESRQAGQPRYMFAPGPVYVEEPPAVWSVSDSGTDMAGACAAFRFADLRRAESPCVCSLNPADASAGFFFFHLCCAYSGRKTGIHFCGIRAIAPR